MSNLLYNSIKTDIINGVIDFSQDQINTILVSSYTPQTSSVTYANVSASEVVGAEYTQNGKTLSGCSVSVSGNVVYFDANDLTWSNSVITASGAIIMKIESPISESKLIGYVDFNGDKIASLEDFTIQWSPNGILTI